MKLKRRIASLLTVMVMAFCMIGIKANAYGLVYYSSSGSSGNNMLYLYSSVSGASGATSYDRFFVNTGGSHTVSCSTNTSTSRTIKLNCSNSSYSITIVVPSGYGVPSTIYATPTLHTGYYYTPQVIPASGATVSGNFIVANAFLKTDAK